MSRVGKMPIAIPAGVTVDIAENNVVTVKGPKGELSRQLPSEMTIKQEGEEIIITRPNDLKRNKAFHGLTRALIHNMVVGVTDGFQKVLENFYRNKQITQTYGTTNGHQDPRRGVEASRTDSYAAGYDRPL